MGRAKKVELDDLATVIFSSGSTGEPKGVLLSHYNIGSNIEQMGQVFSLDGRDCFLGVLPFFHSFGFTGTLCLPAVRGVGVVYHANPLDAKTIGPLACEHQVTFVLATPTFLQLTYAVYPGAVRQRVVAVAAEKLLTSAAAFEGSSASGPSRLMVAPECAPAVSFCTLILPSANRRSGSNAGRLAIHCPAS